MTKMEALAKAEKDAIDRKITYEQLLVARREAYAEKIAEIGNAARVNIWAEEMAARHGSTVQVWRNEMPWPEALLVVRYGEAPGHWPKKFTEQDLLAADKWARGVYLPEGIRMPARRAS